MAESVNARDYMYRGQVVRCHSLYINSGVRTRSTCCVTVQEGDHRQLTADSRREIEAKIDELLTI